jgi:multidrug efflux system membrane fusion protein
VTAGQRLLQIDRAPYELQLRMAQATLARDEALLASATAKESHGQSLLGQHYIAGDDYVQLKANRDSAAAIVDQDKAALDNARLQLSYTTITAPIAGKIGHIAQQVGNTIHVSGQTVLTTLNALDTVDVNFALPEAELSPVRQAVGAAKKALTVSAAPTGSQTHSSGDLTFIDNAADPTTGTIRLRARFDNRKRALWPGQLVDVSMNLPDADVSLVIPDAAVSENSQGSYVFVIKDEVAEQRPIKVLRTADDFAIVSGVQAGEQVVIDGQSRLTHKAHVQVRTDKAAA